MRAVAVTGASGFIGQALCRAWAGHVGEVRAFVRQPERHRSLFPEAAIKLYDSGALRNAEALAGVQVVIHCAARAHILREVSADPVEEFRRTNRDATVALARTCISAGVRRFLFLSSIGVLGNSTAGAPFSERDQPRPGEAYAISKWEAEEGLKAIAGGRELRIVTLRLPLVHGPNPKGNFARLLNAVRHFPVIPVGLANNRRSFLGLQNLCSAVVAAARMPVVAYSTFHLSDTGCISTRRLVQVLGEGVGQQPWLLPLPPWVARAAGTVMGRRRLISQLFDDLEVDASAFSVATDWRPSVSLEDGLRTMASAARPTENSLSTTERRV